MDNAKKVTSKKVNQEELTQEELNSGLDAVSLDQFTEMVNVRNLRVTLTQMMLRDVHKNTNNHTDEEVEDFTTLLLFLEDLE